MNYLSINENTNLPNISISFDGFSYNYGDYFPSINELFPSLSKYINWKK